jgi:dGTPase
LPYDTLSFGRRVPEKRRAGDSREDFARDRDRILYCSSFRRLAGKTQVAASTEYGLYHNRLTHSLKVAQLGRRSAERLRDDYAASRGSPGAPGTVAAPDPDLVEAACLAHDIGHPPFGHIGEKALCETFDRLAIALRGDAEDFDAAPLVEKGTPSPQDLDVARRGGFEGNAQTFRVLDYLATRLPEDPFSGLNLTSATLDAVTKYPWLRVTGSTIRGKWGAVSDDADRLKHIRGKAGVRWKAPKCFEAQLMDWCDDVTYAVHDVVDFYRGGFIALNRLFALSGGPKHRSISDEASEFLSYFLQANPAVGARSARRAWIVIAELSDFTSPWEPSAKVKAATQATTSELITFFLDGLAYEGEPCRHNGRLLIDRDRDRARQKLVAVNLLQELLRFYVIDQPQLRTVQRGQWTIVSTLLEIFASDEELLPVDRREELARHHDLLRAATDHVASLTEAEAEGLYRRLTGHSLGALTDALM